MTKNVRAKAAGLSGAAIILIGSLSGALPVLTQTAFADGSRTVCATTCTDSTVQDAVTNASAGDTIDIQSNQTITSPIAINKQLTIESTNGSIITTTGSNDVFTVNVGGAGSTIQDLTFQKTDSVSQSQLISVNANNVTISGNHFSGQFNIGDSETERAITISGVSGVVISGNSFTHLRQPMYINNASGTVSKNYAADTKGIVVVSESNIAFIGNTWGTGADQNAVDIAIIKDNPVGADNYLSNLMATSAANNNAVIEDQAPATPVMTDVFVDASAASGGNGYPITPYQTISPAISRAVNGGRIHVAAGTYNENVAVNKSLTLSGAQAGNDARSGRTDTSAESTLNGNFKVTADNVTIDGFTITNANPINLNNGGTNNTNETLEHNIINVTGGTGINLNSSNTAISQNKFNMANGIAVVASNNPWHDISITDNSITGTSYIDLNFIGSKSYDATNPANTINTNIVVSGNTSSTNTNNFLMSTFIDGFSVKDNTITNKTGSAIVLGGNDKNVTISGNNVSTTSNAVTVYQYQDAGHPGWPAWPVNGKISINNNNFSGSATGVNVAQNSVDASDSPVDATGNWWGNASGPTDKTSGDSSQPETNPNGTGSAAIGAVKYGPWCTIADCSLTSSSAPGQATNLHAKFQYDSSNVTDGSYLSYTSKPGGNNLELLWTAPSGLVTGYHILATYPDGSQHISYQGPNTNAWLAAYDGFGQHGQGKYVYQVVSVNSNGTATPSADFTLYYDNTKPTVAFTSPTPVANSYESGNFDVGYTASDNVTLKSVNVSLYDTDPAHANHWVATCYSNTAESDASDSGTCTVHIPANTPDGKYYIQVGAQDMALNWSVNQTRTIYIDRATLAAPVLVSPLNNAVVNGASVTNSWGSISGAAKYEYESFNSSNTSGTPRYDATFTGTSKTATNVADGTVFYWRVRAIDQHGKPGNWSDLWKVTIDNSAPNVPTNLAWTDSNGRNLVSGDSTNLIGGTASWQDSSSDVNHYIYKYWNNIPTSAYDGEANAWTTTAGNTSLPGTFNQGQGAHYFCVEAVDAAGNTSACSTPFSVVYDTTAPIVTVDTESTTDTTPTVTGTVNDKTATVSITVNGHSYTASVNQTANLAGTYSWGADVSNVLTAGNSYDVAATATDPAGNVGHDSTTGELTITTVVNSNASNLTYFFSSFLQGGSGSGSSNGRTPGSNNGGVSGNTGNTSPNGSQNGQVLGVSTNTPNTGNTSSDNNSDSSSAVKGLSTTNKNVKNSANFLGLGWWWLPVIVIALLFIFGLSRRTNNDAEKPGA